jgi:hypothetical protein
LIFKLAGCLDAVINFGAVCKGGDFCTSCKAVSCP